MQLCVFVLGLRAHNHVTLALHQLYWLPMLQCIQHKLWTMMLFVHHRMCLAYLAVTVSTIADNPTQPSLCSADSTAYRLPRCCTSIPPWASVHSPTLAHAHGTLCLQHSVTLPTARDSENYSKRTSGSVHWLSIFICNACLDMYVRQAKELCILLLLFFAQWCKMPKG